MKLDIDIKIKPLKRGTARFRHEKWIITIPQWAMDRSEEFGIYYIVHEIAHVVCNEVFKQRGHCDTFKMIEDEYLADFGLVVIRKKAYPKSLIAFGQTVWKN